LFSPVALTQFSVADPALPVNPTERFTGRVDAYRRYRSRYPREIIPWLRERCGSATTSAMQRALKDFFARHQSEGKVRLPMNRRVYVCRLR
jgi:hypothetical protein